MAEDKGKNELVDEVYSDLDKKELCNKLGGRWKPVKVGGKQTTKTCVVDPERLQSDIFQASQVMYDEGYEDAIKER